MFTCVFNAIVDCSIVDWSIEIGEISVAAADQTSVARWKEEKEIGYQ